MKTNKQIPSPNNHHHPTHHVRTTTHTTHSTPTHRPPPTSISNHHALQSLPKTSVQGGTIPPFRHFTSPIMSHLEPTPSRLMNERTKAQHKSTNPDTPTQRSLSHHHAFSHAAPPSAATIACPPEARRVESHSLGQPARFSSTSITNVSRVNKTYTVCRSFKVKAVTNRDR